MRTVHIQSLNGKSRSNAEDALKILKMNARNNVEAKQAMDALVARAALRTNPDR